MSRVQLTGELTIYQATTINQTLQGILTQSIADKTPIELDLSGVTECDGAGLQILLVLARASQANDIMLTLSAVPPGIKALMSEVGLDKRFLFSTTGATA